MVIRDVSGKSGCASLPKEVSVALPMSYAANTASYRSPHLHHSSVLTLHTSTRYRLIPSLWSLRELGLCRGLSVSIQSNTTVVVRTPGRCSLPVIVPCPSGVSSNRSVLYLCISHPAHLLCRAGVVSLEGQLLIINLCSKCGRPVCLKHIASLENTTPSNHHD